MKQRIHDSQWCWCIFWCLFLLILTIQVFHHVTKSPVYNTLILYLLYSVILYNFVHKWMQLAFSSVRSVIQPRDSDSRFTCIFLTSVSPHHLQQVWCSHPQSPFCSVCSVSLLVYSFIFFLSRKLKWKLCFFFLESTGIMANDSNSMLQVCSFWLKETSHIGLDSFQKLWFFSQRAKNEFNAMNTLLNLPRPQKWSQDWSWSLDAANCSW